MWGTKSRFVVVVISKIGLNPGNVFGKDTEKFLSLRNERFIWVSLDLVQVRYGTSSL